MGYVVLFLKRTSDNQMMQIFYRLLTFLTPIKECAEEKTKALTLMRKNACNTIQIYIAHKVACESEAPFGLTCILNSH